MRSRIKNEKHMPHRDKKESKDNLPLPPFNSPLTKVGTTRNRGGHRGVRGEEGGFTGEINIGEEIDFMWFSSLSNFYKVHSLAGRERALFPLFSFLLLLQALLLHKNLYLLPCGMKGR